MAGLLHRGDPAVHGNDQGDSLGVEGVHGCTAESIALLHPVGDIGHHIRPPAAQKTGEEAGGGNAVHVIVSVDSHQLSLLYRAPDALHCPVHVPEQEGVLQALWSARQKLPGLLGRVNATGREDQGGKSRDARLLQGRPARSVSGGALPLLIFHWLRPPFR